MTKEVKQKKCKHSDIRTRNESLTRFQCHKCGKWFNDTNVPDPKYRVEQEKPKSNAPKILLFDLETAPLNAWLWGMWNQNITSFNQLVSPYWIITWSAKWLGSNKVMSDAVTPEEARDQNDFRVVKKLWQLFNEADILIAHNAIDFDIKHSNSRFFIHGLESPSPYKVVDTLKVARKQFRLPSNKLDYIAKVLNIEMKHETTMELWVRCMKGDKDALDYMLKYNEKDVFILEAIYLKMRSWIKSHPNYNIFTTGDDGCSVCGSHKLVKEGTYPAVVQKYDSYRCQECGSFSVATKRKGNKSGYRSVSR